MFRNKNKCNDEIQISHFLDHDQCFNQINNHNKSGALKVSDVVNRALIIAYKEETQLLETALIQEGLNCEVIRQQHQPQYKSFSPSYLCLLNHLRAWKIAAMQSQPTLITEADFVPVVGLGELPLPFNPYQTNVGMCWLYTCASQIYSISAEGYADGFSVSTVAYIVTPQCAGKLIEFATQLLQTSNPETYFTWDSQIDSFLRHHKLKNYVPFRNYGEHGGLPNLEHFLHGLSKTHRADVLYNQLHFLPPYASKSYCKFLSVRLYARIKGIVRLLVGKFLRLRVLKLSPIPARLVSFSIRRQISLHL